MLTEIGQDDGSIEMIRSVHVVLNCRKGAVTAVGEHNCAESEKEPLELDRRKLLLLVARLRVDERANAN